MAHRRRPLVTALALNTGALAVEIGAGIPAKSLSLVMDGVHNLSDEVALGFLVLAYTLRVGLSGRLLRFANLFNSLSVRLFKGFSLSLFGSVSFIHDQLFLPKAGVDEATLLLQRRQLETSFSYQAFLSLSYRFGSTYNNIVNPRFGSGGGFFFISN